MEATLPAGDDCTRWLGWLKQQDIGAGCKEAIELVLDGQEIPRNGYRLRASATRAVLGVGPLIQKRRVRSRPAPSASWESSEPDGLERADRLRIVPREEMTAFTNFRRR